METKSPNRKTARRHQSVADRRTGSDESDAIGTVGCTTANFLNHSFPILRGHTPIVNQTQRETDFFQSLSWACQYFGLPERDNEERPYPYNMAYEVMRLRHLLNGNNITASVRVLSSPDMAACLSVKQILDTGTTLFYIPLEPYSQLVPDDPKALLLKSAITYLSTVAGIPFPAENYYLDNEYYGLLDYYESYAHGEYESPPEGSTQDELDYFEEQQDDCNCRAALIHNAIDGCSQIRSSLTPEDLTLWPDRLAAYQPQTEWDRALKHVCQQLYTLYQTYPTRQVEDNIPTTNDEYDDEGDDRSDNIRLCQYLSFIWADDEIVGEIINNLNQCEYANASGIDEPEVQVVFDKASQPVATDLRFENSLFTLLLDLVNYLTPRTNESN